MRKKKLRFKYERMQLYVGWASYNFKPFNIKKKRNSKTTEKEEKNVTNKCKNVENDAMATKIVHRSHQFVSLLHTYSCASKTISYALLLASAKEVYIIIWKFALAYSGRFRCILRLDVCVFEWLIG